MDNKKPKHFLVLKAIGFTLLAIGIILIISGILIDVPEMGEDNWFEMSSKKSGTIFGGVACCIISSAVLAAGFRPEISKMMTRSAKYIQEENKEDLKDIVGTTADIAGDAITKTTRAIKKGLQENKEDLKDIANISAEINEEAIKKSAKAVKDGFGNKKFCKHCGAEIDADSKFCSHCGKAQ